MTYHSGVKKAHFSQEAQSFFKNKRVVVTGGSGFIGSHVVEQLIELEAQPVVFSRMPEPGPHLFYSRDKMEYFTCDLLDYKRVLEGVEGADVVMSVAASVAGLEYNKNHPASIFQENMELFINTIKAAQEQKVSRFLVTSSACVYPRFCTIPTPEEEGFKEEPEPTNSGYGWSKRMQEYLGQKYTEEFGLSVAIARPYNAYGPRDNFKKESSHVIPALIRKAFEAEKSRFSVWGDGSHSRSFLYVDDFARGLIEVASGYPMADPLNIGNDSEVTIKELSQTIATLVSEVTGQTVEPEFMPTGLTGQPRRKCDNSKIKEKLNFECHVHLKEGLKKTVDWYKENRR